MMYIYIYGYIYIFLSGEKKRKKSLYCSHNLKKRSKQVRCQERPLPLNEGTAARTGEKQL